MIGTTVSHYKILEKLGEGGMGVVYKAEDTKLGRIVALKFLPSHLSSSAGDKARFDQEARAASAINHPNICTIYSIDEHEGTTFIAMEYVEGETLRQKMHAGTLQFKAALDIGIQIAEGLGAAHEKGITHRDIKPDNIIIRNDGLAQIMDFGLAQLRTSTSRVNRLTQEGSTVGTAGYMSPEQVQGHDVDHRSDIFSLGVVLYELFAGQLPFRGMHETALLYEIVNVDPPLMATLKPGLDPALDAVVFECLEKDKNERMQSARQVAIDLKKVKKESSRPRMSRVVAVRPDILESRGRSAPAQAPGRIGRLVWPALSALLLVTLLITVWLLRQPSGSFSQVAKFAITIPPDEFLNLVNHPAVAISPDGSRFVYKASGKFFQRKIDSFDAEPILGTEEGDCPFFSPDGRWLAYFSSGKLRKVPLNGGASVIIADAQNDRGGIWLADGSIVFSPSGRGGLSRVKEDGSNLRIITVEDTTKSERTHRWPQALPDEKHILFTVGYLGSPDYYEDANIDAMNVETGERKTILKGASSARYVPPGYLAYYHAGTLFAAPFNPDRLEITGTAYPVVDNVSGDVTTGASHIAFSDNGTLVYIQGLSTIANRRFVLVDHNGKSTALQAPSQTYVDPRLSPDGKRVAAAVQTDKDFDIWCYDIQRNTMTRLTFGGSNRSPAWSPDGKRIAYSNNTAGTNNNAGHATIEIIQADGSGSSESIPLNIDRTYVNCWTPDGSKLIVTFPHVGMGWDLMILELTGEKKLRTFLATKFDESYAAVSPDGKLIAYSSAETGVPQIYVRPFPLGDAKWQVSPPSISSPVWSSNGKRLFFGTAQGIMGVTIAGTKAITAGEPQMVLKGYIGAQVESSVTFDVAPDGEHILLSRPRDGEESYQRINIVTNWFSDVRNKVTSGK